MNASQKKKLQRLSDEVEEASKNFDAASELVDQANTDEDKEAAQAEYNEAKAVFEKATKELGDYRQQLEQKAPKGSKSKSGTNSDNSKSAKKDDSKTIEVIASRDRRRAGMAFPKGKTIPIPVSDLTEDQLTALRDDPVLSVKE